MAPAIVHFLVGASLLLVLVTPVALGDGLGRLWPLWLVAVGGVWGLVPDLHNVTPIYKTQLRAIHDSRVADVFAFHYTLDRPAVRARDLESTFAAVLFFLIVVSLFTLAALV